jgi:hypothetical protein
MAFVLTTTTQTMNGITQRVIFSTATVQPFTLASIQALIQITTVTLKASPPAQASGPATTSNVKTTQPAKFQAQQPLQMQRRVSQSRLQTQQLLQM